MGTGRYTRIERVLGDIRISRLGTISTLPHNGQLELSSSLLKHRSLSLSSSCTTHKTLEEPSGCNASGSITAVKSVAAVDVVYRRATQTASSGVISPRGCLLYGKNVTTMRGDSGQHWDVHTNSNRSDYPAVPRSSRTILLYMFTYDLPIKQWESLTLNLADNDERTPYMPRSRFYVEREFVWILLSDSIFHSVLFFFKHVLMTEVFGRRRRAI